MKRSQPGNGFPGRGTKNAKAEVGFMISRNRRAHVSQVIHSE